MIKLKTKNLIDYYLGGGLLLFLKPLVIVFGKILQRNHELKIKDKICFIKMLGGGSLVIALPSLLSLKKKYANTEFILITTFAVKPFAEIVNVFDKIIVIDDRTFLKLIISLPVP